MLSLPSLAGHFLFRLETMLFIVPADIKTNVEALEMLLLAGVEPSHFCIDLMDSIATMEAGIQ